MNYLKKSLHFFTKIFNRNTLKIFYINIFFNMKENGLFRKSYQNVKNNEFITEESYDSPRQENQINIKSIEMKVYQSIEIKKEQRINEIKDSRISGDSQHSKLPSNDLNDLVYQKKKEKKESHKIRRSTGPSLMGKLKEAAVRSSLEKVKKTKNIKSLTDVFSENQDSKKIDTQKDVPSATSEDLNQRFLQGSSQLSCNHNILPDNWFNRDEKPVIKKTFNVFNDDMKKEEKNNNIINSGIELQDIKQKKDNQFIEIETDINENSLKQKKGCFLSITLFFKKVFCKKLIQTSLDNKDSYIKDEITFTQKLIHQYLIKKTQNKTVYSFQSRKNNGLITI
jgi:hypothetical protein